jgi:hypothetical protein
VIVYVPDFSPAALLRTIPVSLSLPTSPSAVNVNFGSALPSYLDASIAVTLMAFGFTVIATFAAAAL